MVKFVSETTQGHSIKLVFATLFHITWNYHLVDAIIALSVMYKSFDKTGTSRSPHGALPSLLWMVFGFGLSTRLQQLPLSEGLAIELGRILSFNVGVELGQIAALSVMVGLLALWLHWPSFQRFAYMAHLGLLYAGVYLLFMQLHGYQHDMAPDSFRFSIAEHRHAHEDLDVQNSQDASRDGL